jgi:hypothetical protein
MRLYVNSHASRALEKNAPRFIEREYYRFFAPDERSVDHLKKK